MISSPEERATYNEFAQHLDAYQPIVQKALELSRTKQKAEAGKLYVAEMTQKFGDIRNALSKLVDINRKGAKDATDAAAANYGAARMIAIGTLSIGILIAIAAMASASSASRGQSAPSPARSACSRPATPRPRSPTRPARTRSARCPPPSRCSRTT
jgi:hypothetical protein